MKRTIVKKLTIIGILIVSITVYMYTCSVSITPSYDQKIAEKLYKPRILGE